MDQDFLTKLDAIREKAGIPFILTSAYRSKDWELSKKRDGKSVHTLGKAVDISYANTAACFKIVKAAIELGIRRIGINAKFVHIDTAGDGKAVDVIWMY
ncbi:MAG: D-Ala-D-Ala carboxypeptidase family metallohydrolase [Bacteroidales bacterium]|nr:D-Ala-D-Ala carboxypeptidase family metallohydrolase [Bacteroidales bacterium]